MALHWEGYVPGVWTWTTLAPEHHGFSARVISTKIVHVEVCISAVILVLIVHVEVCISAVILVLNIVVIFRKTGHFEETITTILVLKRRNMMTLCLLVSKQSNMQGN